MGQGLQAQKNKSKEDTLKSYLSSEIVVTGTKTFKRKTESPVIVNILDSKTLHTLQVCNLSEGLKFQPGLRVETDCQTCNYTQLRMNGLQGGYSQILINGRPIFSPMMGLYGMEQLPVNMIERIEVVRGGGSSLYGSSAIGGTVNVITKLPKKNSMELNTFYQNVAGQASDYNLNANATWVGSERNIGMTVFLNHRQRDFFDANQDNFSELPQLKNNAVGFNSFFQFTENQKLEVAGNYIHEYRLGGEMIQTAPHLTQQAEERKHNVWMGSADYQINFNDNTSSLIFYTAFQNTLRAHYTGILPDSIAELTAHLANPPYGNTTATTIQGGFQFNHRLKKWFKSKHVLTLGMEYVSDKVYDQIPSYNYLVNQHTRDGGGFLQSDWDLTPELNLLSGLRIDNHNLLNSLVWSPRFALLYKYKQNTQFRLSYGRGFRAPQAFDTDLHIAFAGGGVSRVQLDKALREENSQSLSASVNYDKSTAKYIAGFTLEAFYTHLDHAFVLQNIGNDSFGEIFEKRNGFGASVRGVTLELRANYNKKIQIESGFTLQNSLFENPIAYMDQVAPRREFLRTPNQYGFANLSWTPNDKWSFNLNYVYTGPMQVAHFGGAENFSTDAIVETDAFSEVNSKITYKMHLHSFIDDFEIYGGIKNMFNAYQNDFDRGKNRDSNYIYGPNAPRTFFVGIRIKT